MKKDIMAKAIRLADKTKARPEKAVIAKPKAQLFAKKPDADVLSERVYARLTKREMKRLKGHVGEMYPISELIRQLITDYLDDHTHDKARKKK